MPTFRPAGSDRGGEGEKLLLKSVRLEHYFNTCVRSGHQHLDTRRGNKRKKPWRFLSPQQQGVPTAVQYCNIPHVYDEIVLECYERLASSASFSWWVRSLGECLERY